MADVLQQAGVVASDAALPAKVRARHAVSRDGQPIHFYLNFSGEPQSFEYAPRRVDRPPGEQARRRAAEDHARSVGPRGDPGVAAPRAVRAQSPPPLPLNWSASSANSTLKLVRLP